jgi:hypothetical protein
VKRHRETKKVNRTLQEKTRHSISDTGKEDVDDDGSNGTTPGDEEHEEAI